MSGLDPDFNSSLEAMFAAAPPELRGQISIESGYRSPERQAQLYQSALQKYGSEAAARKWVAPPGHSNHNRGIAADLSYLSPEALKWAHANAGKFGLAFPLKHENWHIEPVGARGMTAPQNPSSPAVQVASQAGMFAPMPGLDGTNLSDLFAASPASAMPDMAAQQRQRAEQQRARREALFAVTA